MKEAILYLQDGTSFRGRTLKETGETSGEAVFNTAMTGYQEVLTDPSYTGQIVVMTYPLIGNYGVNDEDVESDRIHVKGFVVKEFCRRPSNWRAKKSLIDYLNDNKIIAMEGVDTRALTRHLRMSGAMKAIISTEDFDPKSLQKKLDEMPSMEGMDFVKDVSTLKKYVWKHQGPRRYRIAAIDCGIKFNILRIFSRFRLRGACVSGDRNTQRDHEHQARRDFSFQRPRRSGGCDLCDRYGQRTSGEGPYFRHLLRQSDPGLGLGRQDI